MGYPPNPGYGPPSYPPATPGYPPPAPPAPAPGYGPPPGYGPQPGAYGIPQAPPAAPAVRVSASDFDDQPEFGGGKSISGWFTQPGQWLQGRVPRAITEADYRQKTDMRTKQITQEASFYKDGRPKVDIYIPLQLIAPQPLPPEFPDGRAVWIVSIADYRSEVLPAMEAAGVPRNANGTMPRPEEGAIITVIYEGQKQIQGFGAPKKVKRCQYQRPDGMLPGQPVRGQSEQGDPAGPAPMTAPQAPQAAPPPAPMAPQGPPPQYTPQAAPMTPQLPTTPGAPPYQGAPPAPMPQPAYQAPQGPAPYQGPAAPTGVPQAMQQPVTPPPPPVPQGPPAQNGPAPLPADKDTMFAQLQQGQQQAAPAVTGQQPQG